MCSWSIFSILRIDSKFAIGFLSLQWRTLKKFWIKSSKMCQMWRDLYVYHKSTKPLSPVDTQLEMATDKVSLLIGC